MAIGERALSKTRCPFPYSNKKILGRVAFGFWAAVVAASDLTDDTTFASRAKVKSRRGSIRICDRRDNSYYVSAAARKTGKA
jgi:hypothetical protein